MPLEAPEQFPPTLPPSFFLPPLRGPFLRVPRCPIRSGVPYLDVLETNVRQKLKGPVLILFFRTGPYEWVSGSLTDR